MRAHLSSSDGPVTPDDFDARVTGVAALGEPVRRALYRYVVAQPDPVNRDQAAAGVGVPRHVAKFHLDKLVAEDLLDVTFQRPPGRRGPGAGRPTKLYRRSTKELALTIPERRYDLAGQVMAAAIDASARSGQAVAETLRDEAIALGRAIGEDASRRAGAPGTLASVHEALAGLGFEPRSEPTSITLGNCPFHTLASCYTDLVCSMNLHLIEGLVQGLGAPGIAPKLSPVAGNCCVRVELA